VDILGGGSVFVNWVDIFGISVPVVVDLKRAVFVPVDILGGGSVFVNWVDIFGGGLGGSAGSVFVPVDLLGGGLGGSSVFVPVDILGGGKV
jgi:hypothetical protein